jgi:hypothetical protein
MSSENVNELPSSGFVVWGVSALICVDKNWAPSGNRGRKSYIRFGQSSQDAA